MDNGCYLWFDLNQLYLIKELLLQNNSDLDGFLDMYSDCAPATVIECLKSKRSSTSRLISCVIDAIHHFENIQKCECSNLYEEDLPFE